MFRTKMQNGVETNKKTAVVNLVIVANAFIWYFYSYVFLQKAINASEVSTETATIFGINIATIAVAAILSASRINHSKNRLRFLYYWMLAGVVVSLTPFVINLATFAGLVAFSVIVGLYFGLGMPVCLAYYAAHTKTETRARLSGIVFFFIGLGFILLNSMEISNLMLDAIFLSAWRGAGVAILVTLKPRETKPDTSGRVSFGSVLSNKAFLLYFIPWCLFMIVNLLIAPLTAKLFGNLLSEDVLTLSSGIDNAIAFVVAVISGFFADLIGRKRLTITGFSLLGIGYAVLGLFPGDLNGYWLFTVIDGITWGIFYTIFLITIWGDLAQGKASEKYYSIGSLPFLLAVFVRLSLGTQIVDLVPSYGFFSFAGVFLFLAVLPLVYAPETLPEKTIKERELKGYLEKARKEAEKYS
ncbi:MFS transporter [Candidatus Bathyarchaeota archaeon]|nr:MFS transporter [Candidatus Bathyarchaeota archaeon]